MQHSAVTPIDSLCASEISPPRYIDCYDRAVGILTRHPALLEPAWMLGMTAKSLCHRRRQLVMFCRCLFQNISKDRGIGYSPTIGCLTQICHIGFISEDPELTVAIRADTRIPRGSDITVDHLPIFAGWQRRIDIKLNRKPLPMRIGG